MSKLILMIMIGCSLIAGEVYLYKYNKDGTPYSKTKESTGEVYFYTNLYTEVKNMEITTELIADVRKSSNMDGLRNRAFAFCSAWDNVALKDKTCEKFATKIVDKLLYPKKKLYVEINEIKKSDYRWINNESFLKLQK